MSEDFELPNTAHGEARVIASNGLRLRSVPHLSAPVLELLPCGTVVTVWQTEGLWWWVQTDSGVTGWVHSEYLKVIEELVRDA
jgi:uncharacterized protein YgiM (DUF1202 family)